MKNHLHLEEYKNHQHLKIHLSLKLTFNLFQSYSKSQKKKELEEQALEAIQKHHLFFIQDVVSFLPCSSSTFFGKDLEKLETIKEALAENRIKTKNGLRAKWYKGNSATTQIVLYKLLADEDELKRLNSQYIDHTTPRQKLGSIADWTQQQKEDEFKRLTDPSSPIADHFTTSSEEKPD